MNKRVHERVPAHIDTRFFLGNAVYTGTVINLSEKGMCINSEMCLPCYSKSEFLILFNKKILSVPVRVKWIKLETAGEQFDTMGVEVLNPVKEYEEFVTNIRRKHKPRLSLRISKETLEHTTKCPCNFKCLTPGTGEMCFVERPVNGGGLLLNAETIKNMSCPYLTNNALSFICYCPTRYEIHQKYRI